MKAICYNPILLSSHSSSLLHHPNSNPFSIPYVNSPPSRQGYFPRPTKQPRAYNPVRPRTSPKCLLSEWQQGVHEGEELRVLTSIRTEYNDILIVDSPESRFLLLDSTHNVHSMFNKGVGDNWTGSYWDEFAALPAIVPGGAIGIYGLGGGTAARLMLELWPGVRIVGWEIDEVLVDVAREFLGLVEIEQPNSSGGFVEVRIGDVFGDEAPGVKYAGIVVDLFAGGKVLGDLEKVETWIELKGRLMPGGRIMVNCAGGDYDEDGGGSHRRGSWRSNATIKAMREAFPGELWWKKVARDEGENYLALTGDDPDRDSWSARVRGRLSKSVRDWQVCS